MMIKRKNLLVLFAVLAIGLSSQDYCKANDIDGTKNMSEEIVEILEQSEESYQESEVLEVDLDDFILDDDSFLNGISLDDLQEVEEVEMSLNDKLKLALTLAKIHIMSHKDEYLIGGAAVVVVATMVLLYKYSSKNN